MKYSDDFDELDALFENYYSHHRRQEKTSVSQLNIDICRPIHK